MLTYSQLELGAVYVATSLEIITKINPRYFVKWVVYFFGTLYSFVDAPFFCLTKPRDPELPRNELH